MIYVYITITALLYYAAGWALIMLYYRWNDYEPLRTNVYSSPDRKERFKSCAETSLGLAIAWPIFFVMIGVLMAVYYAAVGIDRFLDRLYDWVHGEKK